MRDVKEEAHLSSIDISRMNVFETEIYRLKTVSAEKRSNTEQVVLDWLIAEVALLQARKKKY
jgi:hypothetical protein